MSTYDLGGGSVVRRPITGDQRPSEAIIRAVVDAGIDHETREETLYDFVDLDALNDLFGRKIVSSGAGVVRFEAWSHSFTVRPDEVVLTETSGVQSASD